MSSYIVVMNFMLLSFKVNYYLNRLVDLYPRLKELCTQLNEFTE